MFDSPIVLSSFVIYLHHNALHEFNGFKSSFLPVYL